jgi:DNA-binding protein HU-beta
MNKEQLVEVVAKKTKLTKKDVQIILDQSLSSISSALAKGEKLTLVGFGTFQVRERKARIGRNPRTGAKLQIAAKKSPVFGAGKVLRELVAGGKKVASGRR